MVGLKKDLLLICNQFPFGFGETFLANEFPYLHKSFRKIVIISRTNVSEQTRTVPADVTLIRIPPKSNILKKIFIPLLCIANLKTLFRLIKDEKASIESIYGNKPTKKQWQKLLHDAFKAFELKFFIKQKALPLLSDNTVIYSYWQNSAALAVTLLKSETPTFQSICRAHRVDLYFYANENNYLSFRQYISKNIDNLFFISDNGLAYQTQLLKTNYPSFVVSRLGTEKVIETHKTKRNNWLLVSCSTIVPTKRLHLIIGALALLVDIDIEWVHFGSGHLENKIKKLAKEKLGNKTTIDYHFEGNVDNMHIHQFYAENHVDLFINVSDSEGIPVSIMEAMSYGIPVAATDVGGTGELVDNFVGILLEKDLTIDRLAKYLAELFSAPEKIKELSNNAYKKWLAGYAAQSNFNNFITRINSFKYENRS